VVLSDDVFRGHRRLLQDLMSPVFLRDVAAPNIYMQACRLVRLWEIKAKCAAGRPFDASGDIFKAALDAVFGFAFGLSWQHSAMQPLIDAITHISVDHGAPDSPASFPEGTQDEVVTATLSLVAAVEKVQGSLSMKLTWLLLSLTPTLRRARRVRERYITDAIREAIAHVIRTSETHTQPLVTSAVEHMVVREQRLADEAGRRPDFFSSAMRGELFGFIVGGHDTTSTTVAWGVKYLADHIPVQERFRTALYAAGSQAKTEGRCPSADEILALRVPYLDAVIEEILRCGGTTPALDREAMVDTQILGRHIPKGTTVLLLTQGPSIRSPPFRVDERLRSETYSSRANSTVHGRSWADHNAEVFDPDRWLVRSQDKNGQDEESFDGTSGPTLAFGLGPRGCWGRRLAYVELRLYLVLIVWNFHLSPCPPELSSYSSIAGITSKPRQCYKPKVIDGIFTYYDGPKPQVDDTSMLWGNNKHLITKTEPVLDLRSLPKPLSEYNHDEDGIQILHKPDISVLKGNLYDHNYVQNHYRQDLGKFIKEKLGLRYCILWGHLVRDVPREVHTKVGEKQVAYPTASGTTAFHLAHVDFSPAGSRAFLRSAGTPDYFKILNNAYIPEEDRVGFFALRGKIIAAEEAAMRKAGIDPEAEKDGQGGHWDWDGSGYDGPRYGVATLWQPLDEVKRDPVAFSLSLDRDLKYTGLRRKYHQLGHESMGEFYFENMLVHPEPRQQWAYIGNQKPEEILFMKFYDTNALESDGNTKSMRVHGAFHVPGTESLPPRRSIETKLFFMYEN
ncbi:heme binding protein, partial [Bipolaris maydis]